MPNSQEIKCAKCNVPLQGLIVDGKPEGIFFCPSCGTGDTYDNTMREIKEQAVDKAADHLAASFERAARGSNFLKFKKNRRPKQIRRFRIDL